MRLALFSFFVVSLWAQQADDLARKSEHARELMAAGRFEEAIPICKELVKAQPGNTGLLLNLALAEHMAGRERESIPHLEAVLKTQPNSIPALLSLGSARLSLNEPQLAVAPLEKAVAAQPKNADARGMLADALMGAGRFEQTAEQFRKLTNAAPGDSRAWYGLGKTYEALGQAAFDKLQKLNPQSPYVSVLVADTRMQRRQYRSAYFFYHEALKQLPDLHGLHTSLAEVYRKTGHSDWAATEEAKERALPVSDCAAHPAECQFLSGHDVEALTQKRATAAPTAEALYWQAKAANELALQSFLRLGQLPPSMEMHQLKAEILDAQDDHLHAIEEWRAALQMSPGNPRLEHELAASLFMAHDYHAALDAATRFLKAHPGSLEMDFIAGDSLLHLEQPEQAEPYLQAALKGDPKLLPAHASLGMVLARLGRNAEALPHLEKALALDDDGSLHYQFSRACQATGQQEKARVAMAQYQEILKRNEQQKTEVAKEAQIGPPQ